MSDTPERPVTKMRGAPRIIRLFDIDVYVHWSWLVVGVLLIQSRSDEYANVLWNIFEYASLFMIVLLHEFGHALACRSVGGVAERIMLWPLGGVAYVRPPQRPGATLWAIAAGPLVNVALLPVTIGFAFAVRTAAPHSNLEHYAVSIAFINAIVLVFNILPIYPLDGGQILRAVLWFFIGPHKSLTIATAIGLFGAGGCLLLAFNFGDFWLMALAGFGALSSWSGLRVARARAAAAQLPRHGHVVCPECREPPPVGRCWPCSQCRAPFDAFEQTGTCPRCGHVEETAGCPFCGGRIPVPAGTAGFTAIAISSEIADAPDTL